MNEIGREVKKAKKFADLSKKYEVAKRKRNYADGVLEGRIRSGQETGMKAIDAKFKTKAEEKNLKELNRLK